MFLSRIQFYCKKQLFPKSNVNFYVLPQISPSPSANAFTVVEAFMMAYKIHCT